MPTHRERDIRDTICRMLDSTGVFDRVDRGMLVDPVGGPSGMTRTASIEPNETTVAGFGDDVSGGLTATTTIKILLIARDDDQITRDDAVELLLNTTAAALNGRSISGITLPGSTRIRSWAWRKATPPERRIEATLEFQYLIEGWSDFDLSI